MLESYLWMYGKWWHYEALCLAPLGVLGSVILFFESPLIIGKVFSVVVGVFCFYLARFALRKAGIIKTPPPPTSTVVSELKSPTIREHLRMKRTIINVLEDIDDGFIDDQPRRCQSTIKNEVCSLQILSVTMGRYTGYQCQTFHRSVQDRAKDSVMTRRAYLVVTKSKLPIQIRQNEAVLPRGDNTHPIWLESPDWTMPQLTSVDVTNACVASREELTELYTALSTVTADVMH